jgi:phosphatidylinositol alpha 1,6-mannosyltransferase
MNTLAILVTTFPPEVSGASHFNWERAQWFSQQGYRVIVFAPDHQNLPSETLSDTLIIERYPSKPWIPYPLTRVPKLSAARWIEDRLAQYQPDLIISTDVDRFIVLGCWQTPGKNYAKANRIPYVAEFHTDLYNFSATYSGWQWLPSLAKAFKIAKPLYRFIDVTLCASQSAAETCHQLGIARTEVIPFCGIDLAQYSPQLRDRSFLHQWLSPAELDHKVVLFLGRLGSEKRVDLVIDAFAKLKQTQPNTSLIIAGDAPQAVVQALKRQAAHISHLHFVGFTLGVAKAKLYAACDVFCSPSPYETFGLTVIEAMASGLPVVTVNAGAVAENVCDRVTGYLAPPNDTDALADSLQTALQSDNRALIQNALQFAQQYSLTKGCERLEQYYQQLIFQSKSLPLVGALS